MTNKGIRRTLIILDDTLDGNQPNLRAISLVLGPGQLIPVSKVKTMDGFDRVLLCAPPDAGERLMQFAFDHLTELSNVPVGLINLNASTGDPTWLPDLVGLIGCQAKQSSIIPPDAPQQAFVEFALAFRGADHRLSEEMPFAELKADVEEFLLNHNTCTFSTSYKGQPHSTPMEYRYQNGHIYLVSEGGDKFAGLLLNPKVTVSVYEPFKGFNSLAGMQITGTATIPLSGSEKHLKSLGIWGLSEQKLSTLPFLLHPIDIWVAEAIFLWSGFEEKGKETRQVFRFY